MTAHYQRMGGLLAQRAAGQSKLSQHPPCPTCNAAGAIPGPEPCTHPTDDREGLNCHRCCDTGRVIVECPDCLGGGTLTDEGTRRYLLAMREDDSGDPF